MLNKILFFFVHVKIFYIIYCYYEINSYICVCQILKRTAMTTKVSMVVQNHLSDALVELSFFSQLKEEDRNITRLRLNFVKWLTSRFSDNLEQEIDPDKEYTLFYNSRVKVAG